MDASGSPKQRAAHYRAQAAQLQNWADAERHDGRRVQLLDLAKQYENLALSTEEARN
jgi:hypothetical protein